MSLSRILVSFLIAVLLVSCPTDAQKKPEKSAAPKGNPVVTMKTSMGVIKIELFADKAPVTVKNFLSYVDGKFFDNTVFHRVISNFMIQGGGFTSSVPIRQKNTKAPIVNESDNGLKNDRGTIAMARIQDPNSATSQFFINVVDNKMLNKSQGNPGYAVFGKVIAGMDVVDKIRAVPTGNGPAISLYNGKELQQNFQDVPKVPVVVESIRRDK
jgi:peptidyl-prolyl cis-trans isomerase A (cyclophilin A)